MNNPWLLCGVGIAFCALGLYRFYKDAFEENGSLKRAILLLIGGVVLIGLAMAKFYRVVQ